jgi:hypothetical protein
MPRRNPKRLLMALPIALLLAAAGLLLPDRAEASNASCYYLTDIVCYNHLVFLVSRQCCAYEYPLPVTTVCGNWGLKWTGSTC